MIQDLASQPIDVSDAIAIRELGKDGNVSSDDDEPTIPCPYCRREIHEDSPRCPHCENYISSEDAPSSPKKWWMIIGFSLCMYAIYRWIVG